MSLLQSSVRAVLALCTVLASTAWAAPLAVVDTVQAPAWLTRGGQVLPLTPGMEVKDTDRINTGANARAYIKLAEGSTVKLGENTQFVFYSEMKQPSDHFRGVLEIAKGAFRYTTGLLGKLKTRDLSVRVGVSTIGIRGTDVWGRAHEAEDMAVLIEGKVEMSRGSESMLLDKPLIQCRVPRDAAMLPLEKIDMSTLESLARETEILPGDGALAKGGRWKLMLGESDNQASALALYDRARNAGYAARIKVSKQAEAHVYTVHLPGFASQAEALAAAPRLKASISVDATPGK